MERMTLKIPFMFQVILGRVLKAAFVFKGIMIEWITVKGFDENFDEIDDLWTESRHRVFRKVQNHTHSAMLHFYSPTLPDLAVRSFMVGFLLSLKKNSSIYSFSFCVDLDS